MKFAKSLLLSTLIVGAIWGVLSLMVVIFTYLNAFALTVVLSVLCVLICAIIIHQSGV